jgi:sulfate transport system ATP-binding protein
MRVTHDQEEAMEVADRIVIMNEGRIEQIGPPRDLYEKPANEFVMSFLGPVNKLGDVLVRPHDVELLLEPNGTSSEALIDRITYLGFEVRVELELPNGRKLWAQTTREAAEPLEPGRTVHVRPRASRTFDGDGAETRPAGDSPWWDRRVTMEVHHS